MSKAEIRSRLLAQRTELTESEIAAFSVQIAEQLQSLLTNKSLIIAAYSPIRSEVDALSIITQLQISKVALPCVDASNKILAFRQWSQGDILKAGAFGVPCPDAAAPVLVPDVLLVPLVAFDAQNTRLGYGGGYYDATLTALKVQNPDIVSIGLAYGFQQVDTLVTEPHDVRLDYIVTEHKIFK